jgi:GntR family transcriptional regulator
MALHLHIDPHSGVPVYRQVMDQIRYHLAAGGLKAGDQLPSVRELARSLGVNPTTVVKAYGELEHAQVIENRHGSGAFVRAATQVGDRERERLLRSLLRRPAVECLQVGASPAQAARALRDEMDQIQKGDP